MSYEAGVSDASKDFGLEKDASAAAALGGLLGAGLGYYLDPQHSWQAALMGGLGGAALGHGAGKWVGGGKSPGLPMSAHYSDGPRAVTVPNAAGMGVGYEPIMRVDKITPEARAAAAIRGHDENTGLRGWFNRTILRRNPGGGVTLIEGGKQASEMGLTLNSSGPGLSMYESPRERLPGMHRWVPREMIEDVYAQLDAGVPPEQIMLREPSPVAGLVGGGAMGGLAGYTLGRSPKSALIGAGLGAATGLAAHKARARRHSGDVREALYGVMRERARNSDDAPNPSAREAVPLTVVTNTGM